ncbi:MAG: DUF1211 domain-containing protein [candidate division Zixibacteria bacterium]|nr:DUF1211 domain-containing protein [candidate division Zixibacteria bacterium]
MTRNRLEAFSDGVVAILITIMVLEFKVPQGADWEALVPLVPVFMSYILSFVILGIYWNNHHHMLHTAERINGKILWANLHLLFWLSLFPFETGWMGRTHAAPLPTATYGAVMLMAAVAYLILQQTIVSHQGPDSRLREAIGGYLKGKTSIALYGLSIPLAFIHPWLAIGIYILVALIWLVPDRRIEAKMGG